ncbi:hypothetical protein GCM10023093_15830 [Nemorincola caseinilytica]|uniref:Uncharacterized protein n=2 Tax=Nemorincola caseinilytica TaxID=2054315 RepID=A0ABP8NEZ4_9BACT
MLLAACSDDKPAASGPIVMGDPSTIVTESDPQQLKDLVADLNPVIPPSQDPEEPKPADTPAATSQPAAAQQQQPAPSALPSGPGLRAEFRDVTIVVPGLEVKQSGNKNLQNANGAVYTLTNGNINGATITISGTVTKVSQRYQSVVMMKSDIGDIPLDALSITSRWETVKGSGNTYKIAGLDERSIQFYDADNEDIRSAVQKAARRRRVSHRRMQDMLNDVRKVRSVNQKPLHGELRSVMWKIDGKDASGRAFSKQIRVDIPM